MEDLRALNRRWFEEVWNNGRDDVIEQMYAPDGIAYGLGEGGAPVKGPANFRKFYEKFRQGLGGIHVDVHETVVEGDLIAARISCRATHVGEGFGVPPTGKPIRFTAIVMSRWKNGQIVEAWNEFDAYGMMQQIAGAASPSVKAELA